jgi:chorismate-pyruvate lyase
MPEGSVLSPEFSPRYLKEHSTAERSVPPWAALLERFYNRAGLPFPAILRIKGSEMPEPYRSLLVHSNDMTPTLECFHGQKLTLKVLSRERTEHRYLREVTLNMENTGTPVEYGAIKIYLEHFPSHVRERILEEHTPLGAILQSEAIAHVGWPQASFRIQADRHVSEHLHIAGNTELFGRRNVLLDAHRKMLAQVIEILPPVDRVI